MSPEERLEAIRAAAEELAATTARVEAAFKLEAQKAQRAVIQANRWAPHSEETLALDKLHRAAVKQWAQAQADAGRAHRSVVALRSSMAHRAAVRARSGQEVRNGAQVHPGPDRAGDSRLGRAS